jgi:hypothetical protein
MVKIRDGGLGGKGGGDVLTNVQICGEGCLAATTGAGGVAGEMVPTSAAVPG